MAEYTNPPGYSESPDQKYAGWHERPTQDGVIVVWLKKSGVLDANKYPVPNWDYTTAQKLIDDFVATGHYPTDRSTYPIV